MGNTRTKKGVLHGRYIGTSRPELIGTTAMIIITGYTTLSIQSDDIQTGYGFGWHKMSPKDWELDEAYKVQF